MNGMLNMLLSSDQVGGINGWMPAIKITLLVVMIICAVFIICVVLFQPSNSSGVSALSGTTETFLSKNKGKTKESKLKKLTVISAIIFCVFAIIFAILALLFPVA